MNGLGLAAWRNAAAADDEDADHNVTDSLDSAGAMDKIAFGFMTWQLNATLLHYTSKSTGDMLEIKLVSFIFLDIIDISRVIFQFNTGRIWFYYQRVSIASYASAGIARGGMSVCLSVRLSVTLRYCIKTKKDARA